MKISKYLLFGLFLIPVVHELIHAAICLLFNVHIDFIGFDVTRFSYTITPPDLFFMLHDLNDIITTLSIIPLFYGIIKTLMLNGIIRKGN